MFKVLLKTSFRNIFRNRTNSAINVLSLTIGIACSITVFSVITYQYTFDHNQPKADRIYRVNYHVQDERGIARYAQTPEPLHHALRDDYPQVENVGRTLGPVASTLYIEDDKFRQEGVLYANPEFLKLFQFDWLLGNAETALDDPKAVILTESTAAKLFGNNDPIGQIIDFEHRDKGIVSGVIKDRRRNTNLPFHMLVNSEMLNQIQRYFVADNWGSNSIGITWVLLPDAVDPANLEKQFDQVVTKYLDERYHETTSFNLLPLKELHTDDRYGNAMNYTIPAETIYGLIIIGAIILIACCINFVNLSTAMAMKRAKEVGVKKILGSSRKHLMFQFFIELGLITTIGGFIALWLAEIGLNQINAHLSLVSLDFALETNAFIFALLIVILITIIAGLYPVIKLIRFKPAETLRGTSSKLQSSKSLVPNILLGVQFVFSQILVIILLVFNGQFSYIKNKDLGFETKNIMTFDHFFESTPENINRVKQELLSDPNVEMISFGTGGPNAIFSWGTTVVDPKDPEKKEINSDYKHVDIDYKDLFKLDIIAGSWFTPSNYLSDTLQKVIVNEKLVQELGLSSNEDALNYPITVNERPGRIIGVVENFHSAGLKSLIRPAVIEGDFEGYQQGFIKYKPGSYAKVAEHFETLSTSINPEYVPSYAGYEEELSKDYILDEVIFRFINFMTAIALIIGCLGLYSLISFIAQQRTKEIGIRKVIGANVSGLMILLSRKFLWVILIAFLVAAPVGYMGSKIWLEGFQYSIGIGPVIFVLALVITLTISSLSVSYRAFKAASTNPIKSLRYE